MPVKSPRGTGAAHYAAVLGVNMSGEMTVDDHELRALGDALTSFGASTRGGSGPDATAAMSTTLPGSHVAWVARQVASVLERQLATVGDRLTGLGDAARTNGANYVRSDEIPAYLFDRLGR
jgi:hypothetical protein